MREMEKPFFVRKNKLVRTTTFTTTLLIAAILLISSVVPAAIQVNNSNNELRTKNDDMQQSNQQTATDLRSVDRTVSTYPSKMSKITNEGTNNLMDLWDNGLPDGVNGVSCGQFSGLNREIVDDFVTSGPWMVDGAEMRFVTYNGYGPEAISGVNVMFFEDAGGVPSTTEYASRTATFSGILTGNYYFSRPEVLETLSFDAVVLNSGTTYWVDIQPIASDNIFWLTSPGYGSQIYLSYPDMGYPRWTPGYTVFYAYYYGVSFKLTGSIAGVEHDVGVNSIVDPVSGAAGAEFTPKIKVGNNGNQTEVDVPIEMTIDHFVEGIPNTYYLNEPFNSFLPSGWTQDGSWTQGYSNAAGGTYPEAYLPYYNIYYSYAYLASPAVNTNSATNLHLTFRSLVDDWMGYSGYSCKVWVYDGSTWQDKTPWANPITGNQGPALYDVDITTIKSSSTQVMFEFSGTAYNMDYWYVDDVQIVQPGIPGYWVNEYDEILYVDIPKGGLLDVIFPTWEPAGWQAVEGQDIDYEINAWTSLVGDEIPSNDLKTKSISLSYPYFHDIAVMSINDPTEDGPAKTLPVGCTIKNVGQNEECCYQTGMIIGQQLVVGTPMSQDFSSGSMPPAGWTDEHKSYVYYYGWYISYSTQSGGSSPEAYLPYYYALAGYKFYSNAFDTSAYAGSVLEFKSYINHYYGQGYYTLKAAASTNYGPWVEVWSYEPSASGKFEVSVPIPSGINTRVAFYMEGDPWYFNYWYLDDIVVNGVDVVEEYDEVYCTIELAPGESMDLEFNDWTPADLALGVSGDIDYIVVAEQLLPTDTNPANDKMSDGFTLSYWHDVKVKDITDPSMGNRGDVIFAQRPYTSSESWSFYTTAIPGGYECMDDFWDLTSPIGGIEFWGLCLIYSYGWTPGNQNALEFELKFYEDNAGTPGNLVTTIPLPAITPVLYDTFSGYPAYHWVYDDLGGGVDLVDGWISIQSIQASDNAWLLWSGGPEGNFNALQNGGGLGDNLAFNLSAGGGPGPGQVKVWVPLNSQEEIAGIVQNVGVFDELALTCYADIWEFITDPDNATLVYSDSISNIDLAPLGGEETVIFDPFTFTMEGVYSLQLDIPVVNDDLQANNVKKIGIGVDDTKPTSTHALNPSTPSGLNGWYVGDVTVTLDADDGDDDWQSGVKEIVYKVNGVQKTIPGGHGSFKIEDDGDNIPVEYWAVDKVGNEESPHHTFSIDMDQNKPTISLVYEVTGGNPIVGYEVTFTATATDDMSGMERVDFYLNALIEITVTGSGPTYEWIVNLGNIPNLVIKAIGYDMAGNNDFDEIEDPTPHSNEQTLPSSSTTLKINLGR